MKRGVVILIGLIALLGIAAVVFFMMSGGEDTPADEDTTVVAPDQPTPTPLIQTEQIVVAVQDLPRGIKIPENGVGIAEWPVNALPEEGNFFYADQLLQGEVVGLYTRTDIPRGAPILVRHVVPDLAEISAVGSDAAAIMNSQPPGTVAIAIPLDISGIGQVAYGIQDGDYVDVILSFLFVDVDPTFQTRMPNNVSLITRLETGELSIGAPSQGRTEASTLSPEGVLIGPSEESQRPRLVTQRTVTNAWVIHVGDFPAGGAFIGATPTSAIEPTTAPGEGEQQQQQQALPATATPFAPYIMTLAVSPQEALVLVWAIDSQIPITLALRQAGDPTEVETVPVSLDYMISTYNVPPPDALEFALEPPITSVRRFDVDALFDFLGASLD
ncbi:MAG: hypothetical protein JXA10_00175 [Anaerolineae bacterium]|nr:hypothetical protein [Anaerolineae bacterium]